MMAGECKIVAGIHCCQTGMAGLILWCLVISCVKLLMIHLTILSVGK